jgi:hypothetical protein
MPPEDSPSPPPGDALKYIRRAYRPKNKLDPFLKTYIGGKYKHERYELLERYFRQKNMTEEEIKKIIKKFQTEGVSSNVASMLGGFLFELKAAESQAKLHARGEAGAKARWKNHKKEENNKKDKSA